MQCDARVAIRARVPEAEVVQTAELVAKVMEGAPLPAVRLGVPLVAEAGWGKNWAEAH